MGLFRDLRQALALGAEITALRADATQLRMEWTDVLDQMKAREERMRKRDRAKVREIVQEDEPPAPPEQPQLFFGKDMLRAAARARGLMR